MTKILLKSLNNFHHPPLEVNGLTSKTTEKNNKQQVVNYHSISPFLNISISFCPELTYKHVLFTPSPSISSCISFSCLAFNNISIDFFFLTYRHIPISLISQNSFLLLISHFFSFLSKHFMGRVESNSQSYIIG